MGKSFSRGKYYAVLLTLFSVGCQKAPESLSKNLVTAQSTPVERSLGEARKPFWVMDAQTFARKSAKGLIALPTSEEAKKSLSALALKADSTSVPVSTTPPALILGFPLGLLGENHVFGGVVTKVSDQTNEKLGGLKLSSLPPLHVKPMITSAGAGMFALGLVGCAQDCAEGADESVLAALPVLGIDRTKNAVLVDISSLGDSLNLVKMMDPKGTYTQLKTKLNKTAAFDYAFSTLVFDVETVMEPVVAPSTPVAETTFTVRWFLRLSSTFDPGFVTRPATDGVGFFMTERSSRPAIQRFALPRRLDGNDKGSVHYFIKGVPKDFRPAFQASFDDWNGHFLSVIGKKLLSYEFVESTDPRFALLVPGDVRYNIVEWDTQNRASYGGLGPSIANQYSGETLSANVLIQGPTIVKMYTKWFAVSKEAQLLIAQGDPSGAQRLLLKTAKALQRELDAPRPRVSLALGNLAFHIPAQNPQLEDPLFQREDFEPLPAGYDYTTYMAGYFREMVSHELGHNLGLRHNFRGNLGAALAPATGAVSRSIMEYLNRSFRYLDRIGPYDTMAIAYGYAGKKPMDLGHFCTDEHVGGEEEPLLTAECSRDDATYDPFAYFEGQLGKAMKLLLATDTSEAPVWRIPDMEREFSVAVIGLGRYASSAHSTSKDWTNFFIDRTRPRIAADIPAYVLSRLKAHMCGPAIDAVLATKTQPAALKATQDNVQAVRERVMKVMTKLKAFTEAELSCSP